MIKEKKDIKIELTANEWQYVVDSLLSHASNTLAISNAGEAHRLYGLRVLEIKDLIESQIKSR